MEEIDRNTYDLFEQEACVPTDAYEQAAFAEFLNNRSLNAQQIRFVEMVIDQLTARGVMKDSALYEAPFSQLHTGGPDELFAGKEAVVDNLFATLNAVHTGLASVVNQ